MAKTTTTKEVSIYDFDEKAANERGVEIELERPDGKRTGIFVTVLGEQSEAVKTFMYRAINARRRQEAVNASKRNRSVEVRPIQEDEALTIDRAVASVIGWRGPKEEFSEAALRDLLERNPAFTVQILDKSGDSAAFSAG